MPLIELLGGVAKFSPDVLAAIGRAIDGPTELRKSRSKIMQAREEIADFIERGYLVEQLQPLIDATNRLASLLLEANEARRDHEQNMADITRFAKPTRLSVASCKWGAGGYTKEMDTLQKAVNDELNIIKDLRPRNKCQTDGNGSSGSPKSDSPCRGDGYASSQPSSATSSPHKTVLFEPVGVKYCQGEVVEYWSTTYNTWLSTEVSQVHVDAEGLLRRIDLECRPDAEICRIRRPSKTSFETTTKLPSRTVLLETEPEMEQPQGQRVLPAPLYADGCYIQASRLSVHTHLNGQVGRVVSFAGGPDRRYHVHIAGQEVKIKELDLSRCEQPQMHVPSSASARQEEARCSSDTPGKEPEDQQVYEIGSHVLIRSNEPHLNGQKGQVQGYIGGSDKRYRVYVDEEVMTLKEMNLSPAPPEPTQTSPSVPQTQETLTPPDAPAIYQPYSHVVIKGLQKQSTLNENVGQVLSYEGGASRRYKVFVMGKAHLVKESNMCDYESYVWPQRQRRATLP